MIRNVLPWLWSKIATNCKERRCWEEREKYGSKVQIAEEVYGRFDGKTGGTYFDFLVYDENGNILEVVESKAKGHKSNNNMDLSDQQERFYNGGESVTIDGKNAPDVLKGKKINNKKVESSVYRWTVNEFSGKVKNIFLKLIKKK